MFCIPLSIPVFAASDSPGVAPGSFAPESPSPGCGMQKALDRDGTMVTTSDPGAAIALGNQDAQRKPNRRALARFLRRCSQFDGMMAVVIVVVLLAFVFGARWIAPYDPYSVNLSLANQPPSWNHIMGTDDYGRDLFSRIVYGARYSLAMGFIVTTTSTIIGLVLGSIAGFSGGRVDEVLMRFTDMVMGFPALLFAMIVAAVLGANLTNTIIAAAVVWWPTYVRLVRGQVLARKNELYVEAARSIGVATPMVLARHILPNSWSPVLVQGTMDLGRAVIFTGSLSFIGLGAAPPMPEWGAMLAEARWLILDSWWYVAFPGLAIFASVFAFSILGDVFEDTFEQ